MLVDSGVSDLVFLKAGYKHEGIDLRFGGESHRIDFQDLVGEAWLYPQNEVFVDLAAARERDGGEVHFSVSDTEVLDQTTDTPKIRFDDSEGNAKEIHAEILVGADGAAGICKWSIPHEYRTDNFVEYPFAWFGILCQARPSAEELDLLQFQPRVRPDQPKGRPHPANVLPVPLGRGRRRMDRGNDLG